LLIPLYNLPKLVSKIKIPAKAQSPAGVKY